MDKGKIIFIGVALAAVLFAVLGIRKAQPGPVESLYLGQVETLMARGIEDDSYKGALEEVKRYATFAMTQDVEAEYPDGEQADKALKALMDVYHDVNSDVEEEASKVMRQGRAKELAQDGLAFIKKQVEARVQVRGFLYYGMAGALAFAVFLTLALKSLKLSRRSKDRLIQACFMVTAMTSILILFLIMLFLFREGLPIFEKISVSDFIFGQYWYPTEEEDPEFGIFALIIGSFSVTALSSIIAIPLGVMTAIYLAEIATPGVRNVVKPIIELLASLPSVVIGFFGMVIVAPFLQNTFGISTGLNMFNASIMLAFMSVPTITSVSEDAIFAVPGELKEGALALGATHFETIWTVVIPASISGIATAVILGMSRAIGETMVVLMVAGGAAMMPTSIFDPVRPMPASIAAEMGEAPFQSDHYFALFATGIVLFIFTLIFNVVADHIAQKYRQVGAATL